MKTIILICGFDQNDALSVSQQLYELFRGKSYFADIVPTILPLDVLHSIHTETKSQPYIMVFGTLLSEEGMDQTKDILKTLLSLNVPEDTVVIRVPASDPIYVRKSQKANLPIEV